MLCSRNATDKFNLVAEDVGPLSRVDVRVVASSPDNVTWHLDTIEVENSTSGQTGR